MTIVIGIELHGTYVAYREDDLIERGVIEDRVDGVRILISRDDAGITRVLEPSTQETMPKQRSFWFTWYAFHPNTRLFLPLDN